MKFGDRCYVGLYCRGLSTWSAMRRQCFSDYQCVLSHKRWGSPVNIMSRQLAEGRINSWQGHEEVFLFALHQNQLWSPHSLLSSGYQKHFSWV